MRILSDNAANACHVKVKLVFEDKRFADFLGYAQEQLLFLYMNEGANLSDLKEYDERLNYTDGRVDFRASVRPYTYIDIKFYVKQLKNRKNFTRETTHVWAFEHRINVVIEETTLDNEDTDTAIHELAAQLALAAVARLDA